MVVQKKVLSLQHQTNKNIKIMYQIEIELNDIIYLVEYSCTKGECTTYEQLGTPDEINLIGVYADGVEQDDLDWSTIEELTYRIEEYHEDEF